MPSGRAGLAGGGYARRSGGANARTVSSAGAGDLGRPGAGSATDREGDICVALLAIAEHAGTAWAVRARTALLTAFNLRAENDGNLETGALLLGDLRTIIVGTSSKQMTSEDLCKRLGDMDDRPWPEWKAGKPMTQVQLANALRPFGIRPTTIRIGVTTPRGYLREAFEEAWSRYLSNAKTPPSAEEGASKPKHQNNAANSTPYGENGATTAGS